MVLSRPGHRATLYLFLLETVFNLVTKTLMGTNPVIPGYNADFFQRSIAVRSGALTACTRGPPAATGARLPLPTPGAGDSPAEQD